jgi:DHA2 family multidrug resistance protein-like MFS transporter
MASLVMVSLVCRRIDADSCNSTPGSPGFVIAGGLAFAAVGVGLLTQLNEEASFVILAAGLVVFSLDLAPVFTLATGVVVASAPPEHAGAASAISETTGELGGVLGIAILDSVGAAIYRSELARTIPTGVPAEAQEAARDTLAGAVEVARQLPGDLGSMPLDAARNSFILGLQVDIIISVAIAAVAAVLVFVGLRNVLSGSEDEKSTLANERVEESD